MVTDTFFFIGGCSGSFAAPTETRAVFDPNAPYQLRHVPFSRQIHGSRTTCYLLRHRDTVIVVDEGLGVETVSEIILDMLAAEQQNGVTVHLLQSHFHEDHIEGMRANALFFQRGMTLRFYSPDLHGYRGSNGASESDGSSSSTRSACPVMLTMRDVLEAEFCESYWPVTIQLLDEIGAKREHAQFSPGETLSIDDVTVRTLPLQHPGGCVGFRFEIPGAGTVVVASDCEPPDQTNPELIEFFDGADLLLADMQYRDSEYRGEAAIGRRPENCFTRAGWGHGTPELLLPQLIACRQRPERIRVIHHDPKRPDDDLQAFCDESQQLWNRWSQHAAIDFNFAREGEAFWL